MPTATKRSESARKPIKGWFMAGAQPNVPPSSTNIAFGVMLGGRGDAWIDDVSFEIVDRSVPVTDCPCCRNNRPTQCSGLVAFQRLRRKIV